LEVSRDARVEQSDEIKMSSSLCEVKFQGKSQVRCLENP
jgi:hypothetical protein